LNNTIYTCERCYIFATTGSRVGSSRTLHRSLTNGWQFLLKFPKYRLFARIDNFLYRMKTFGWIYLSDPKLNQIIRNGPSLSYTPIKSLNFYKLIQIPHSHAQQYQHSPLNHPQSTLLPLLYLLIYYYFGVFIYNFNIQIDSLWNASSFSKNKILIFLWNISEIYVFKKKFSEISFLSSRAVNNSYSEQAWQKGPVEIEVYSWTARNCEVYVVLCSQVSKLSLTPKGQNTSISISQIPAKQIMLYIWTLKMQVFFLGEWKRHVRKNNTVYPCNGQRKSVANATSNLANSVHITKLTVHRTKNTSFSVHIIQLTVHSTKTSFFLRNVGCHQNSSTYIKDTGYNEKTYNNGREYLASSWV